MVPLAGVEPARGISPLDFESSASANFTTEANNYLYLLQIVSIFGIIIWKNYIKKRFTARLLYDNITIFFFWQAD